MSIAQTAPQLFQETKKTWIDGARVIARNLLRDKHRITIEDVTREYPLPNYLHRNTIGAVFNAKEFEPVGFTTATNPAARGHVIRYWSLRENDKASVEVDCEA